MSPSTRINPLTLKSPRRCEPSPTIELTTLDSISGTRGPLSVTGNARKAVAHLQEAGRINHLIAKGKYKIQVRPG